MPTFEDALLIIKEVTASVYAGTDDFFQDCCVAVLENGDFSEKAVKVVCQAVRKKHIGAIIREKCTRHKLIYTDDGECLDDNLIFVENPWEEESVGSYISDEVKAKMKPLAKLVETTVLLGKTAFHRNLFVTMCCTRNPKKVFQQQDLSVLLRLQRLLRKTPMTYRNPQPAQQNHKKMFDLKKGKKNG